MTLIMADTSSARERSAASVVTRGMRCLLKARYHKTVSRAEFLARWQDLRVLLKLTPEYQRMLRIVFARDKVCTRCGAQDPTDPHHKRPVSRYPNLACDPVNVEVICHNCHLAHHSPSSPHPPSTIMVQPHHTPTPPPHPSQRAVGTHPSTFQGGRGV